MKIIKISLSLALCDAEDEMRRKSSRYPRKRMLNVDLRKARTMKRTLVKTRGADVRPKQSVLNSYLSEETLYYINNLAKSIKKF